MNVIMLYHMRDEHSGLVEDYSKEFERFKSKKINLVPLETPEGADMAELYGVDRYPAIIVMADNGSMVRLWQGIPLPLMDELSYYMPNEQAMAVRSGKTILPAPATAVI